MPSPKAALKALRTWPPFNSVATTATRAVLDVVHARPEWVVSHLHRAGTVRSRLPNGRVLSLWSRGDDWVSNQVFWRGWDGYEPETVPLFFRLAQDAEVTLDIGAYVGFFSLLAGHANPSGRVFAFEPMSAIFERLQRHITLNELDHVRCTRSAVGESVGTVEFFHMPLELPTSSSVSGEFMEHLPGVQRTEVPLTTVDTFVKEAGIQRVDLVKIDTERTEPQVLRGMMETLHRDRPTLFVEVLAGSPTGAELQDILRPLGYHFYLLTPDGPVEEARVEGHSEWLNHLFTPRPPAEVAALHAETQGRRSTGS